MTSISFGVRALAVAAAMTVSGGAFAKTAPSSSELTLQKTGATSFLSSAIPALRSELVSIDVTGLQSFDGLGAPGNSVVLFQLAPNAEVLGIGWDTNVTAFGASWLSEIAVSFGSTTAGFVNLNVGAGEVNNVPGTASFSSGGIIDLVGLGFNFNVGADGLLRMEFFDSFDDVPGVADGAWNSGALTISVSAIPEPGTYGLMALGLLGVAAFARRRKA